jgi:hypothetical protein
MHLTWPLIFLALLFVGIGLSIWSFLKNKGIQKIISLFTRTNTMPDSNQPLQPAVPAVVPGTVPATSQPAAQSGEALHFQPPIFPQIQTIDKTIYNDFLSKYDDGSKTFPNMVYRKGAGVTCPFGLSEGFKTKPDGTMEWGWVRIHTGVDRAGALSVTDTTGKIWKDAIINPFDADATDYIYYGPRQSYGFLTMLYLTKYGFMFWIGHMNPQTDINPWVYQQLKAKAPLPKGIILGSAGDFGDSDGSHTHTELYSIHERSEVLELALYDQYGDDIFKEYSSDDILKQYREYDHFKDPSIKDEVILQDWAAQKAARNAFFINKYYYRFNEGGSGKTKTRYSTTYALAGL